VPTNTYTSLATVTLGGSDAETIFGSIPATYRDLVIVISGTASGETSPSVRFNEDAGENYANLRMFANPSTYTQQAFNASYGSLGYMNTERSSVVMHILDYSVTTKQKVAFGRNSNTGTLRFEAVRWTNTSAIHTISVRMDGAQTYSTGTVISLYGIVG
jgi:hypothetical protein